MPGPPDTPIPSTPALAKFCYVDYLNIVNAVSKILNIKIRSHTFFEVDEVNLLNHKQKVSFFHVLL